MPAFELTETRTVDAALLKVIAGVRYWEDAMVNGVEDEDGDLIPFRDGDTWCPVIDIDAGEVLAWPTGTTASVHYKVCDAGSYELLDRAGERLASIEGYVPSIMSPGGNGYGDYIIMTIGEDGKIANWRVDLSAFEDQDA